MKESYRSLCDQFVPGYDIIFIARNTITNSKCADVKKSIEAATKRAGILKK
jgi:ribonuclease P protein component